MAKKVLIILIKLDALMKRLPISKSQTIHITDAISSHGVKPTEICLTTTYGILEPQQDMMQEQQLLHKDH